MKEQFLKSIRLAEKPSAKNIKQRVSKIYDTLIKHIFKEVCRSMFEQHKFMLSFLFSITIMKIEGKLDQKEWIFLLTGMVDEKVQQLKNPKADVFPDNIWNNINTLSALDNFKNFNMQVIKNISVWINFYKKIETEELPQPYNQLDPFKKLILYRYLSPELFVSKAKILVGSVLGSYFTTPINFTWADTFQESVSPSVPLLYILSPGDDAYEDINQFSRECDQLFISLSLGRGQGELASRQIREAMSRGAWILLQNCHLASSWMHNLEDIIEYIGQEEKSKRLNENFRLWLTSSSTSDFPLSLIQNSIKFTKDPPKGVKSNLRDIYNNLSSSKFEREFFDSCTKQSEWKKLVLSLSFFHAIMRERKKFGSIGWNVQYDFNRSDFKISIKQLNFMLSNYSQIQFPALNYIIGECYYGGKVTDQWDRRIVLTLLEDFLNSNAISYDKFTFSPVEKYFVPEEIGLQEASQFIDSLPDEEPPELFGLHKNAYINSCVNESQLLINSLLILTPISKKANVDDIARISKITSDYITDLPRKLEFEKAQRNFPNNYYESLNTFLLQEITRYNSLLEDISQDLDQILKAFNGDTILSDQIKMNIESVFKNIVPTAWIKHSYPSLKSLAGYFKDLHLRFDMYKTWIDEGIPKVFWMSGFYSPHSFLTAIFQNYSRARSIPIDRLRFDYDVRKEGDIPSFTPKEGCFIRGLFIEGATWDTENDCLEESLYKVLYKEMPIIKFTPTDAENTSLKRKDVYICPLYRTLERKGVLTTTGHSSNFIVDLDLRTEVPKENWIKRGVALVTQLID